MGDTGTQDLKSFVEALKARIGPVSTLAEAEPWWPLALTIDASMTHGDALAAFRKQASHTLLWAVSDAITTLKRSGEPNLDRVRKALMDLEGDAPGLLASIQTPRPARDGKTTGDEAPQAVG